MSKVIDSPKKAPTISASAPKSVTFMDLREGRCKFPLGGLNEPPEWFCGVATVIGTPYCTDCQKLAYSRPERRR